MDTNAFVLIGYCIGILGLIGLVCFVRWFRAPDEDSWDLILNESIEEQVESLQDEIFDEWQRAREKFGPFASSHEGFAVLLEEVDELKAEVWSNETRNPDRTAKMRKEAVQVAAMALRFLTDVTDHVEYIDADDNDTHQLQAPYQEPSQAVE